MTAPRHRRHRSSFPRPVRSSSARDHAPLTKGQRILGVVQEALPDTSFRVRLEDGRIVLAHLAGKLRVHFIRVLTGDRVTVELSAYDQTRGRIVYRDR